MINKIFITIALLIFHADTYAQDLYTQVFGNRETKTSLEFFVAKKSIGEIEVIMQGETLKKVSSKNFLEKLKILLKEKQFNKINFNSEYINLQESPYQIEYDVRSLKGIIKIPLEHLKVSLKFMDNNPKLEYAGISLEKAPFATGLSLRGERRFADSYFGGNYVSTSYDSFINLKGFVLEATGYYEEQLDTDERGYWFHGNKSLTKDWIDKRVRFKLGDTNTGRFGFMNSYQIGGVSVKRTFSIDPYNRPYPEGAEEFQIYTRSRVKTFVNGNLIKDEFLPAGNYQFSNLPLINGLNFVRIEILDEFGGSRILEYNIPTSINLLKGGESNFSFSSGKPFIDQGLVRTYDEENLHSAYYQYGVNSFFSTGLFAQAFNEFSLYGLTEGVATSWGNLFYDFAVSENLNNDDEKVSGIGNSLSWQYQLQGTNYFNGVATLLRYQNLHKDFSSDYTFSPVPIKESLDVNLSLPVLKQLTLNVGAGVATYQDLSLPRRETLNISGNWRIKRSMNLNFYSTRIKDHTGEENVTSSLFLTWTFDDSTKYATFYRDVENKQNRITFTEDNNNKLYEPIFTLTADTDDEENSQAGELNVRLPTPMADFSLRGAAANIDGETYGLQGITVGSSLLAAYDDGFAFAISRPNANSFALFKPSDNLENEKIVLRSTSPYADTETPLIGNLALTNLVPYQYREIEIDPTYLSDGLSLEKESFVLFPEYKSAHLIKIKDKGVKSIKAKIIVKGKPYSLKLGKLNGVLFFTDREGNTFIEGIDSNLLKLEISGFRPVEIKLNDKQSGIINIGTINIK